MTLRAGFVNLAMTSVSWGNFEVSMEHFEK